MTTDLFKILNPEFSKYIVDPYRFNLIKKRIKQGPYGICNSASMQKGEDLIFFISRRFSNSPLSDEQIQYYINEARFLMGLNHPFMSQYYGFSYKDPFVFLTEQNYSSTLYQAINDPALKKTLTGTEKTTIAICVATCMCYLHSLNIVNYDLCSSNVLLYQNDYPKLGFFSSHPYKDYFSDFTIKNNKYEITQWTPPQLYGDDTIPTPKDDVYSYGIILWELLTEKCPFADTNPSEFPLQIGKCNERPTIPPKAPKRIKKLIELCWSPDPEDRPSYSQILELFNAGKIAFDNTDFNAIHDLLVIANQHKFANTPKPSQNAPTDIDVTNFFKVSELKDILEYTNSLDETNCLQFFNGVSQLLKESVSDEIKYTALFEILQLISSNPKCLLIYIQTNPLPQLPFLNEYFSELCLSLLIPIFSVSPLSLDTNLLKTLETLTSQFPIKVTRLISVLSSGDLSIDIAKRLLEFLIVQSNLLIQNDASLPLVHTIYKLVQRYKKLLETYGQPILRIFSSCLSSGSTEIVQTTYNALFLLNPFSLPVDPEVLVRHIQNDAIRDISLKFLSIFRPIKITQKLLETLLQETKRTPEAQFAVLNLARHADVAHLLMSKLSAWMVFESVSIDMMLKIILVLMQQAANKIQLVRCVPLLPKRLSSAIDKNRLDIMDALYRIVQNLPNDINFINSLSSSGFLTSYLKIANETKNEGLILRSYFMIDHFGKIVFLPDYLVFLPTVKTHLFSNSKIRNNAINYCNVIQTDPRGRDALIQANMLQPVRK